MFRWTGSTAVEASLGGVRFMRSSVARGGWLPLGCKSSTVKAALFCDRQRKYDGGSPSAVHSRPWLMALCATTSTTPSAGSCAHRHLIVRCKTNQCEGRCVIGRTARISVQHSAARYHSSLPPHTPHPAPLPPMSLDAPSKKKKSFGRPTASGPSRVRRSPDGEAAVQLELVWLLLPPPVSVSEPRLAFRLRRRGACPRSALRTEKGARLTGAKEGNNSHVSQSQPPPAAPSTRSCTGSSTGVRVCVLAGGRAASRRGTLSGWLAGWRGR